MKAFLSLFLCLVAVSFPGYVLAEGDGGAITVTGTITLVGNEPFPELIITTDTKESYSITGAKRDELIQKQGQRFTLTGKKGKGSGVYAPYSIEVERYQAPQANTDNQFMIWLKNLFGWK